MSLPRANEGGFSLMMVAFSLVLLLGVAAFAIDLSAMRLDQALDQRVADAAASAGALATCESGGQSCETAIAYVELNVPQVGSLDTSGCSSVPATCNPLNATEVTQFAGRFTVTMVYPVPDTHALMDPGALGASSQPVVTADGDPCERFGVKIAPSMTLRLHR